MVSPLTSMVLFTVTAPSAAPPPDHDPAHTGAALLIVATVIAAAVVTETIRHRRGRLVHRPVPIPPRSAVADGAPTERTHRDLAKRPVLLVHRP